MKIEFWLKKNQIQWFIRIATSDFTNFRRLKSLENHVKTNVQNQIIIEFEIFLFISIYNFSLFNTDIKSRHDQLNLSK